MAINHKHPELKEVLDYIHLTEAAISGDVQDYVPKLVDQSEAEHQKYVRRAAYYDMVGRTQAALVGAMTRKPFELVGADDINVDGSKGLNDGVGSMYASIFGSGRVGVLVDYDDDLGAPKLIPYDSDDIVNWYGEGTKEGDFVILKADEVIRDPDDKYTTVVAPRLLELFIESGIYQSRIWERTSKHGMTEKWEVKAGSERVPQALGKALNFIPFYAANAWTAGITPCKPPLTTMAGLNIQHYCTSVFIAHGSRYFALPKPYVAGRLQDAATGTINLASTDVMLLEAGSSTGYLEFGGANGMAFLAGERDKLEEQCMTLGSRMLTQKTGVESVEAMELRMGTEAAILVSIVDAVNAMLNEALAVYSQFIPGKPTITVDLNRDLTGNNLSPTETKALLELYQAGTITLETLLKRLYDGELVDDVEEELAALKVQDAGMPAVLTFLQKGLISGEAAVAEAKRRGILSADVQAMNAVSQGAPAGSGTRTSV